MNERCGNNRSKYFLSVFILVAGAGIFLGAGERADASWQCVAHRGYSSAAPENTLAAIDAAIQLGAHGAEFDVQRCATGEIVLMHDNTVDRTTDGTGDVQTLSWDQLQGLDAGSWFSPAFAGEKVPSLNQALSHLNNSGTKAVVELKRDDSTIAAGVLQAIRNANMVDQAVVISFYPAVVGAIYQNQTAQHIQSGMLVDTTSLMAGGIWSSWAYMTNAQKADWLTGAIAYYHADFLDIEHSLLNQGLVSELLANGTTVWAWTVDTETRQDELLSWGVSSVTTNRPDLMVPEPASILLLFGGFAVNSLRRKRNG